MSRFGRSRVFAVWLLVLGLLLGACAPAAAPAPTAPKSAPTTAPTKPAEAAKPVEAAKPTQAAKPSEAAKPAEGVKPAEAKPTTPPAGAPKPAGPTAKVRWIVSTTQLLEDTAVYSSLPIALGYWAEEGLDVEVATVQGGATAAQLVASGQGDATPTGTADGLFIPRGQGVKMQGFYNIVPGFFQNPAVAADSPIQSPQDFKGKRIGVQSLSAGGVSNISAMARDAGLDPEKDLNFIAVGLGAQAATALFETKQIDVLSLWDGQYAAIENANPNYKLRVLSTPLSDRLGFNIAAMAMEDQLKQRPEVYAKLARGLAKATVFALANPEAAVQLHWRVYPEAKPQAASEAEAIQKGVRTMSGRLSNMDIATKKPARDKWGYIPKEEVESLYSVLVKPSGRVASEIDIDQVYTNALIDQVNAFDIEAIRKQARDWKP